MNEDNLTYFYTVHLRYQEVESNKAYNNKSLDIVR